MNLSDDFVNTLIANDVSFQTNDQVDTALFSGYMARLGLTVNDYRELVKSKYLANNLSDFISKSEFALDSSALDFIRATNQQRSLSSLKLDLNKIDKYESVDYFLFDYKPLKGELPGGNSKSFDWNIIKNLKTKKQWFLSGGINTNNIKQIIDDINPFGVDLSSGVEKELGIKDNHIINNFIDKLKNA